MKCCYFLFTFILLTSAAVVCSQQLSFKLYTSAEGLSQNSGYCMAQDGLGYLWMGTQDGLNKFNGKKITVKNVQEVIEEFVKAAKEGDELTVVVSRKKSETSKAKKVKLKSKLIPVLPSASNNLILLPDASEQQLKLRADWIGKH